MVRARYLGFTALVCLSIPNLASAAASMETIGAEKCGGRVTAFEVVITDTGGHTLTLANVLKANLVSDDFVFV